MAEIKLDGDKILCVCCDEQAESFTPEEYKVEEGWEPVIVGYCKKCWGVLFAIEKSFDDLASVSPVFENSYHALEQYQNFIDYKESLLAQD